MTDNKNELKQVMDWLKEEVVPFLYINSFENTDMGLKAECLGAYSVSVLATLDRLSAPVGVKKIEGLHDAISIQDLPCPHEDIEFENISKRYSDHADIYGCDVSETLEEAARAYLELQNADHIASVGKMVAPDGNMVVPYEPSSKQLDAAVSFALNVKLSSEYGWTNYTRDLYQTMLSAAPTPAPTEIDLDGLKHDACIDCEAMNSTESCFVEMAIDYIATRYDFVRKV